MSSSSRVPLLVGGNKGRKPTRLPIAPRARPANVDRAKRALGADEADGPSASQETSTPSHVDATTSQPAAEPHKSPERAALPAVLPVAVAVAPPALPAIQLPPPVSTPQPRTGGISPGSAIAVSVPVNRAPLHTGQARSPLLSAAVPVERLARMAPKSSIPLFRPPEPRSHASPILGPRATPIPAPHPHGLHGEQPQEQNPLLKRMARKLDIKPHQSPRRAALHSAGQAPRTASPLALSTPVAAVLESPSAPPRAKKATKEATTTAKRGVKRRAAAVEKQAAGENTNTGNQPSSKRRTPRRTAKKVGSYRDPSDSMDDADGDDDGDYEQTRDDDDDLDLPEVDNPQIFMPARERATLWAKKVLEQSDDPNALALVPKKERTKRKRSNSASSIGSVATPRKSKADEGPQKEPSQMTMGELAMSIPKGRRMLRHEHEEAADHHNGFDAGMSRSRSLSLSSESASMGGSLVTPQVEIIDGKMVISESTVKVVETPSFGAAASDDGEDTARRPRGSRYAAPNSAPGRRWSKDETKQFYYCLSQVGPNFSMMATLFPARKRKELKSKFKYEEKHHPTLIEIALKASTAPLDSEIVDVIARMAEKDAQKKEAKRRSQSEDLADGVQSPSTVSSTAVPTPPPVQDDFAEDRFGGYYRERKDSYDFSN
ncbi:hypothetical protein PINS_up022042 [Pythium insidiosum]|nr:hypothetical protein PINS_up022042 [Pythium insidiosum]